MKKQFSYILISLLALLMLGPVIPTSTSATSNSQQFRQQKKEQVEINRLNNRTKQQAKKQLQNRINHMKKAHPNTKIKIINQKPTKLNQNQINQNLKQMKQQTLKDINHERQQRGLSKLKLNHKLDNLATLRSNQIQTNFNHFSSKGQPMTNIDAPKVKLPQIFQASENIASASLGDCHMTGDDITYHNKNGVQMADMDNNGMMYHDQIEHNGHRKNILAKSSTLVGIGASYNPIKHTFYLAEDFGNQNPNYSDDIHNVNTNDYDVTPKQAHENRRQAKNLLEQFLYNCNQVFKKLITFLKSHF